MKESIMIIIPWVAIGISFVIAAYDFWRRCKEKKARKAERLAAVMAGEVQDDDLPKEETEDFQVGKGMSVGVLIGICLGAIFRFDLLLGLSLGLLGGAILGLIARRENN